MQRSSSHSGSSILESEPALSVSAGATSPLDAEKLGPAVADGLSLAHQAELPANVRKEEKPSGELLCADSSMAFETAEIANAAVQALEDLPQSPHVATAVNADLKPTEESKSDWQHPLPPKRRRSIRAATRSVGGAGDHAPQFPWRILVLSMLLFTAGLPWYLEQVTYAALRGRERAISEVAKDQLSKTAAGELSQVSRLVAKAVRPCVVRIHTWRSFEEGIRGVGELHRDQGEGSGVVVSEQGYIVTNAHVVGENPESIEVQFSDGSSETAELVGQDEPTDLAVLKVKARSLTPAVWGDSRSLSEGDMVWAMGSPFGLDQSITFGIVSAKGRRGKAGTPHQDFLQTDAAVNPGNSGGPLLNSRGEIVGINTAILGDVYRGISFAVPSEIAEKVCQTIIKEGKVVRGWLGVKMASQRAPWQFRKEAGVGVVGVLAGSPAEAAGIKAGDHILSWGESSVACKEDLSLAVANSRVGNQVEINLVRDGQPMTLAVTVGSLPSETR